MDVKFLNPFIEAAFEVMKAELGVTAVRGNLSLQKTAMTTNDITVLIHLVGQVYGVVTYGMATQTGLNMVSKIMGQEFDDLDSLAQSGVAELGNVISGRATIKFSQAGYDSNISPPTLISGKNVKISTLDFSRVVVPLITDLGELEVHLALREGAVGKGNPSENFIPLAIETAQPAG